MKLRLGSIHYICTCREGSGAQDEFPDCDRLRLRVS
jgi:hypothetical protein